MVVQSSQLAYGGDLPACPSTGGGEFPYGPDNSPEKAGEGRSHGPCLQPTPGELVSLQLIHGDVGAGHQVFSIVTADDEGDPSLDSPFEQHDPRGVLILPDVQFRFPRVFCGNCRYGRYPNVGCKLSRFKGFPQMRRFASIIEKN